MIATASPAVTHAVDSLNTLRYASMVKAPGQKKRRVVDAPVAQQDVTVNTRGRFVCITIAVSETHLMA